jgi:formate dehydrogenase subunit delta
MELARLAYMADQIARNFAAQGEDIAIAATAEHIRLFWDPRMKAQLLAADRAALTPLVAAVTAHLETTMSKSP